MTDNYLYFNNGSSYYPMKSVYGDIHEENRCFTNRRHMRVYDIRLYFISDFQDGEELVIDRVSGKSKYYFYEHMRCSL